LKRPLSSDGQRAWPTKRIGNIAPSAMTKEQSGTQTARSRSIDKESAIDGQARKTCCVRPSVVTPTSETNLSRGLKDPVCERQHTSGHISEDTAEADISSTPSQTLALVEKPCCRESEMPFTVGPTPASKVNGNNDLTSQQLGSNLRAKSPFHDPIAPRLGGDSRLGSLVQQTSETGPFAASNGFQQSATALPSVSEKQSSELGMTNFTNNCTCGDYCACFACSTHPYNKTTLDYVRYHSTLLGDITETPTLYSDPQQMYFTQLEAQAAYHSNSGAANRSRASSQGIEWHLGNIRRESQVPGEVSQWLPSMPPATAPAYESTCNHLPRPQRDAANLPTEVGTSVDTSMSAMPENTLSRVPQARLFENVATESLAQMDVASDSKSSEMPQMLSPTSIFVHQLTVSNCEDTRDICQRGNGCECSGCFVQSADLSSPRPMLTPQPTVENTDCGHSCASCCAPRVKQPMQPSLQSVRSLSRLRSSDANVAKSPAVPSHLAYPILSMPTPLFTHIHGPNCDCPGGMIIEAQAQMHAHAQMHGPHCDCSLGEQYLRAHMQAAAKLHPEFQAQLRVENWIRASPRPGSVDGRAFGLRNELGVTRPYSEVGMFEQDKDQAGKSGTGCSCGTGCFNVRPFVPGRTP